MSMALRRPSFFAPVLAVRAGALAAFLLLLPACVEAKSYTIPDAEPVAVVTIPEDWDVNEIDKGVEAQSEDEEVYIAIEVTNLVVADKAVRDTILWLKRKGVVVDQATEKKKPFSINGMDGFDVSWSGKDNDGPTLISLTLLQVNDTKGLVVTYWGSPSGTKDNAAELVDIIASLKPVR